MAKRKTRKSGPTPVESIRHKDKRTNIPTEELRDFVAEDEKAPKTMLYPRDPSLDPQLVWKGKDEQDRADLAVPVVPIYIQEKIHPQAIIEDLRRTHPPMTQMSTDKDPHRCPSVPSVDQLLLFADFNGGPTEFDQKIEFYQHEQNWANRMILGDSLLVMTSLAEKEGLKGKVQTIYFDPPYGIKFGSNWQVSTRKRDVRDGKAEDCTRQPEQIRAFRDCWRIGVHSYLAYIRDILTTARELLSETGSVFVQISDQNVHLVRSVLDEVFGSEHCVVTILFKKKGGQKSSYVDPVNDYLLWYSKTPRDVPGQGPKFRPLFVPRTLDADALQSFNLAELPDGSVHPLHAVMLAEGDIRDYRLRPQQLFQDVRGARLLTSENLTSGGVRTNQSLPFTWDGNTFEPKTGNSWKHTARPTKPGETCGMERLARAGRILAAENTWRYKRFFDDFPFNSLENWWDSVGGASEPVYVVQTNTEIVKRCLLMTSDPGDLVLDPTCGSGTTAYVAEQWGRRWITIDTSRVALALARTRLMSAKYSYYLLADSQEGIAKEAELTGKIPPPHQTDNDIRKGFVYHRVTHVTSSTIANIPDIREGMSRKQIDEAIARHAETETLFDQPYEDNRRIRVTGPFSVESLSPHRVLSTDDTDGHRSAGKCRDSSPHLCSSVKSVDDFAIMIIDNLRRAGVQNTRKDERLKFDRLDPFAGTWIHATGEYTDADGKPKRVAVSVGPEHGTVGPQQVKEAAKEAVQGVGFDVLIVCGFAFDPHVSEEVKRYGKLTVLATRMNPDLAMGDELLKKTGAGNLFMVFGEPDVEIRRISTDDTDEHRLKGRKKYLSGEAAQTHLRPSVKSVDQFVVEIKGVDVYDPTTGQIRSSSTDDIACWFIDTEYNGESFFVRHAYFTGADEPYEKLKRALRAEIDEAAWSSLYSTTSRPFDKPETGKIAVKVINHYGDEVLKVFTL